MPRVAVFLKLLQATGGKEFLGATAGLSSSAALDCVATMERSSVHLKRVRHFDAPNHFHELTFSCFDRLPLLTKDTWCLMLSDSIDRAIQRHRYALIAFVYMPEHVHLLVFPRKSASPIEELLRAIKRPFSFRVKSALARIQSPLLKKVTIRQRPGVEAFRFWQEGPGYDRNLISLEAALASSEYIHLNPVRRGLVESALDWRWSSIHHHVESICGPDPGLPLICSLSEILVR